MWSELEVVESVLETTTTRTNEWRHQILICHHYRDENGRVIDRAIQDAH